MIPPRPYPHLLLGEPPLSELPEDLEPIEPHYLWFISQLPCVMDETGLVIGVDIPFGFPGEIQRRVYLRWKILFDLIDLGMNPTTELITQVATREIPPGTTLDEAVLLFL